MAISGAGGAEPEWQAAVVVRTDPTLSTELAVRWESASGQRAVGVTDLLALRPAYWRRVAAPVPPEPAQAARIEAGRRLHRALGVVLAPEAQLEVRLRRSGIAARIDAISDRPIEIKTSAYATDPEDLLEERPEHVEQLAIYCALADRPAGRLLAVRMEPDADPEIRATDLEFREIGAIGREMHRRAEQLLTAVRLGDPSDLPRCRWFDRGCEFRRAGVCDCSGAEAPAPVWIAREVVRLTPRPDEDQRLGPRLAEANRSVPVARIPRFRDLVYPRRAFFELRTPLEETGRSASRRTPTGGAYERLVEAIEGGSLGEVARLPSRSSEPDEEVPGFRGIPYLARTSRSPIVPRVEEMVGRFPQYALELGFRCAATGTSRGRAIVAYERAADPADRLGVVEFEFAPVTVFSRLWRGRAAALERALVTGDPRELAPCPSWMFPECPYRDECACGVAPLRSQR